MSYRSHHRDFALDRTPPLNVDDPLDPRLNRRAINLRWLLATSLFGLAAAGLMSGALRIAMQHTANATRPVFALAQIFDTPPSDADGRGDRIEAKRLSVPDSSVNVTRFEQVDASAIKHFIHLVASLKPAPDAPAMVSQPAAAETAGTIELPPVMTAGAAPPVQANAYAAPDSSPQQLVPVGTPINMTAVAEGVASAVKTKQRVVMAKAGDTLDAILPVLGVAAADADEIASVIDGDNGASFSGGERVILVQDVNDADGQGLRPLEVKIERPGAPAIAAALADSGHYVEAVALDGSIATSPDEDAVLAIGEPASASSDAQSIRDSLYGLQGEQHLDRSVIDELVRVCAHDVDFDLPASADDKVNLLVDTGSLDEGRGSDLVFASLTVGGQAHSYYRFAAPDDGSVDYYDDGGRSVTESLLRKPVANGRLGDGFGWRIHPILKDRRFHEGVDYAAPFGSPVVAAGSGVVEKIDYEGGYGKYIRVRHDRGYETTYAHVSGFPASMRVGTRVRQGETIAYIGSTGLSTGPHLYYEVKINGHNVDPLRVRLESGRILTGSVLAAFDEARLHIDKLVTVADKH